MQLYIYNITSICALVLVRYKCDVKTTADILYEQYRRKGVLCLFKTKNWQNNGAVDFCFEEIIHYTSRSHFYDYSGSF